MKKISLFFTIVLLFCVALTVNAAGTELTVSSKLDKSSYKIGDTATLTVEYSVPFIAESSASMTLSTKGLSKATLSSAQTLVCDDQTCQMHSNTDFLSFSNNKLKLGPGYSGTVEFTFTVENAEQIKVDVTLSHDGSNVKDSSKATVSDYKPAETPKPTAKPTTEPTKKPDSKPTDKPQNTTAPETDNGEASTPVTGGMSYIMPALTAIFLGSAVLIKKH